LEVSEERVQKVLAKLNLHKAPGPDNLPNWIFKEYSYLLALPVMKIINASYYEQQLPIPSGRKQMFRRYLKKKQ
jgi:hypothetical protein